MNNSNANVSRQPATLVVGHVLGRYLPRSETFTYDLIQALPFAQRIFASRTENLDLFPDDRLDVVGSESEYPALLSRHAVRLLFCHFGPVAVAGLPVARAAGIPIVALFHGYDMSMVLRDPRWVERYRTLLSEGDHAICVAEAGRRRLLEIGAPPGRVSTIHLGVDTARFEYRDPRSRRSADPVRILAVARLTEKKGLDVGLRALRLVIDRGVAAQLRIAGEGEDAHALRRLAATLGVEDSVVFLGALSHAEVAEEQRGADVLIQPSLTASTGDQEGIPVALMEAMASGVPVVSTWHSGISELVLNEETGLLVPERDPAALARAVIRVAQEPPLGRRFARAARARVEQEFNLKVQAARIAALLERVAVPSRWNAGGGDHDRRAGTGEAA